MKRTIRRLTVLGATGAIALAGLTASPAHASTRSVVVDSDADGMPDTWERAHSLDAHRANAKEDPDHDGLGNLNEMKLHGNPHDPDTDNDGSDDGDERRDHTRPDLADTDHNGRRDGNEDTDHDGISNENEDDAQEACISDDADTDHDGISDEDEDETHTNVNVADTDHDGVPDGSEDRDHDGRLNEDEDDHSGDRCVHDADHDGTEDEDEGDVFGTIASFDSSTGALAISTTDGPVTVTVTPATELKFSDDVESQTAPAATSTSTRQGSSDDPEGDDHGGTATTADLKPGVGVAEVEYHHGELDEIELIRTA